MSRYIGGNLLFVLAVVTVGTVKAIRIVVDQIDDATSNWTGLR